VLYADAYMFVQDKFYQFDIDIIEDVMTQLSLKTAIKDWGKMQCELLRQKQGSCTREEVSKQNIL
jgi:hypothetical protein